MGWGPGCATQAVRNQIEAWVTHSKMFFRRLLAGPGSNIVWTFSAGNNCMYGPSSPYAANEDLPNVIDVAATNDGGRLASFSNYGVDVAAPGGVEPSSPAIDINSCPEDNALNAGRCGLLSSTVGRCPGGYCAERGEIAGTSMAAPVVAGVAALVASKHPQFTAAEIGTCIKSTAGTAGVGSTGPPNGQPGGDYAHPPLSYIGAPIPIVNAAAAVACQGGNTTVQIAPHGPVYGPAGFGMEVIVPPCVYLEVSFDGEPAFTESTSAGLTDHFLPTTLSTLSIGPHQMSFTCRNEWEGPVVWTSPGFEIKVTAGPIPLGLESDTVPAGGELVFTSGPSLGEAQCPSLPGVGLAELLIYLDSTGEPAASVAYRFVPMPDGRATEGLRVPADADPADEYAALARCYYRNGAGELGIFQFAWEWGNVTVTGGSGTTASDDAPDRGPATPAWPTVASPSGIFGPVYIRGAGAGS
jgi:hypothetical protein